MTSGNRSRMTSRNRSRVVLCLCALSLASGGCADLQIISADECGNAVLEPALGEACDGEADCGAPGTPYACRILCSDGSCREGHACGTDGVCRAPSGAFEVLSTAATATVLDLFAGDVNADGCSELLISERQGITLTAFESREPGACPAATQELPTGRAPDNALSRPAPLLADMNGDGRPDLLRAAQAQYGDGLFVDVGGPTPAVASILYPTVRAREERVRPLAVVHQGKDALLLLLDNPMGMGGVGMAGVVDPEYLPQPAGGLPGTLAELVILASADLGPVPPPPGEQACDPCDEVLVGFAGQGQIFAAALFTGKSRSGAAIVSAAMPQPVIKLPQGTTLRDWNASIAVVDVDGDGALDVIVNTKSGSGMVGGPLVVAYGTGDGRFHSTSPADKVAPDGATSPLPLPAVPPGTPDPAEFDAYFVAADLDPGQPGIEVEPLPCPEAPAVSSAACDAVTKGCEAVVLDIDGDGEPEIVSTESQQPGLLLRRRTASGGYHVSSVDTRCQPHELAVGDFDDDGVDDLAFFDQVRQTSLTGAEATPADTLMIVHGNEYSDPSVPVESGRFDAVQGLATGRFSGDTAVTQLYAARTLQEKDIVSGFSLVEGYGERRLFAPYYLPYGMNDEQKNLRRVLMTAATTGLFTFGSPDGVSAEQPLFAVAMVTEDLAGSAPASGSAALRLIDRRVGGSSLLQSPGAGDAPTCDGCVLAALDIPECPGTGGPDELLLLGDGQLTMYSVQGDVKDGFFFEPCQPPQEVSRSFSFVDSSAGPQKYVPRPLVADLDRDGRTDVTLRDEAGELVVLWSRAGGFDLEPVAFPARSPAVACGGKCSAALVDMGGDDTDGPELLIVAPGGLVLYTVGADRVFEERPLPPGLADIAPAENTDFTAVVAADLDGDGVHDLALMPSSGLLVTLRGVPVHP